jgi:hypothetical protein
MQTQRLFRPVGMTGHSWHLYQAGKFLDWYNAGATSPFPNFTGRQTTLKQLKAILADLDRASGEAMIADDKAASLASLAKHGLTPKDLGQFRREKIVAELKAKAGR